MRIDAPWLHSPMTSLLFDLFNHHKHKLYFVGGCVRDAILGFESHDIDFATSAKPHEMFNIAKSTSINVLPTGIEFGTVTFKMGESSFQVTTFRSDIKADGRYPVVEFTRDLEVDAQRRDFTINSLYCDYDGIVFDPNGGIVDLENRYVRFIGDPAQRIREDTLRVLRFFRFNTYLGTIFENYDQSAWEAISAFNAVELEHLSGYRIKNEFFRILASRKPSIGLDAMGKLGLLNHLLPGIDIEYIARMESCEEHIGLPPDTMRRLACLNGTSICDILPLTREEGSFIKQVELDSKHRKPVEAIAYSSGVNTAITVALLHSIRANKLPSRNLLDRVAKASKQVFPVNPADLLKDFSGSEISGILEILEQKWLDSGFELTREDLLDTIQLA